MEVWEFSELPNLFCLNSESKRNTRAEAIMLFGGRIAYEL